MRDCVSRLRVVVAEPHGFCTGVRRAIAMAEKALADASARGGGRLYCLHELVHNKLVVDALAEKGMVFVRDLSEVPDGGAVLFSAHGVSPAVRAEAERRGLSVIDATCVFVGKVHENVRHYAGEGCTVLLIGRRTHDEVLGVAGEAPDSVRVVESVDDVENVDVPDPAKVAVLTQTTLAAYQVEPVIAAIRRRFPLACIPDRSGICFATTERQEAVRRLARESEVVLVLGSSTSANSNRLVDVAREAGARAELLPDAAAVRAFVADGGLAGVACVGVTAGASTPEYVVEEVVSFLGGL